MHLQAKSSSNYHTVDTVVSVDWSGSFCLHPVLSYGIQQINILNHICWNESCARSIGIRCVFDGMLQNQR